MSCSGTKPVQTYFHNVPSDLHMPSYTSAVKYVPISFWHIIDGNLPFRIAFPKMYEYEVELRSNIFVGSQKIKNFYVGDDKVLKMYLGDKLVMG